MTWDRIREKAILKLFSNYNVTSHENKFDIESVRLFSSSVIPLRLLDQCGYGVGMYTHRAANPNSTEPLVAN